MNNIEVKLFLDGEDGDEFPLGVVPAPVIRRHPIASPHCIPLFSRPIVALPSPSDGGVGQGRSRDARAAGRTDEGRRRRGRRGLPIPTNSTDDNEGENKNKAAERRPYARTHAPRPSPDRELANEFLRRRRGTLCRRQSERRSRFLCAASKEGERLFHAVPSVQSTSSYSSPPRVSCSGSALN